MKRNFTLIILTILILVGYYSWPAINSNEIKYIKIAGQKVKVELALTKEAQALGLSGRNELQENEGMLFVPDLPGKHSFWMKDMNFPIDIIWLASSEGGDEEVRIVYIKKSAQPESYPEIYTPDKEAKYILEVVAGFSKKNNLKIGDSISFR